MSLFFAKAAGQRADLCILLSLPCEGISLHVHFGVRRTWQWKSSFSRVMGYCTEVIAPPQGEALLHSGVIYRRDAEDWSALTPSEARSMSSCERSL